MINTQNEKKYISGEWEHDFGDSQQSTVRFVADVNNLKLIKLEVLGNDGYRLASKSEFLDIEDSLLNGNDEVFDNPDDFGLKLTSEIPSW